MPAPRSLLRLPLRLTVSVFFLGIIGCSGPDPVGPLGNEFSVLGTKATTADAAGFGSSSFYPLAIGNAWAYHGEGSFHSVRNGLPGETELTYAFTEARHLIGTTTHEGTPYFVEEQVRQAIPQGDDGPYKWWGRIRQDRTGLYFLDTLLSNPPALEVGTAQPMPSGNGRRALISTTALRQSGKVNAALERLAGRLDYVRDAVRGFGQVGSIAASGLQLTELVYPLRVGESWSIRPDFPWPARVDRVETLDTPAGRVTAYRLETNPGGTVVHEGEWIRLWWSREGFLGYSLHLVDEQTDLNGEPTGALYVADESMIVTSIAISK